MANPIVKSPFSDAVGQSAVPTTPSSGGKFDAMETVDVPGRDGGYLKELSRDGAVSGSPKVSGPAKSPFKDAVS